MECCATTIRLRSDGISMKCHPRVEPAVTFPFQRVKELKLQTVVSEYRRHLCVIRSFVFQNKNQSQKKKNISCFFFPIPNFVLNWKMGYCYLGYFDLGCVDPGVCMRQMAAVISSGLSVALLPSLKSTNVWFFLLDGFC